MDTRNVSVCEFHTLDSMYVARCPGSITRAPIDNSHPYLINIIPLCFQKISPRLFSFISRLLAFYEIDHITWIPKAPGHQNIRTEIDLDWNLIVNEIQTRDIDSICLAFCNENTRCLVGIIPFIASQEFYDVICCLKIIISNGDFLEDDRELAMKFYNGFKRAINIRYGNIDFEKISISNVNKQYCSPLLLQEAIFTKIDGKNK